MINLNDKLSNIHQILLELDGTFKIYDNFTEIGNFDEKLRKLNFEANEFFENLTPDFNLSNPLLTKIIQTITNILNRPIMNDSFFFELKMNIINLQIYIPIHLLFILSSNNLKVQIEQQSSLESLVDLIYQFKETPQINKATNLDQKHIIDSYLRIFGSMGDLYYLLCSNLLLVKKNYLVKWANNCFNQFHMLDQTIEKFDPLEFYKTNNLPVEDLYREIVGHYTILGNTNASNLLEFLLSLGKSNLIKEISFKPYLPIEPPALPDLVVKLEGKENKIHSLLQRVAEAKKANIYFSENDDPLNIISFKLMRTLEQYFRFTNAKLLCYEKEYNQLMTPASTELKNVLELCENWIETTLSLTEENENILDTPFGGLFNSVFLEYLLLLALDEGKRITLGEERIPILEEKLEKFKHIYLHENQVFEQISDFIYYKTYSQIYIYSLIGSETTIRELIDEMYSFLQFLESKPFLKINSLFLITVLEVVVNKKPYQSLKNITDQIVQMTHPDYGLVHLKQDVEEYLAIINKLSDKKEFTMESLAYRSKLKVLDVNSWLIPHLESFLDTSQKSFKIISFNQFGDRIL